MLNDIDVENLIQPFAERQKKIENYIVNLIAKRIREIGTMKPSDIYKLERMLKTGSDVRDINKMLAKLTGLQESEIKKVIKEVASDSYQDAKPFYDYRQKPFIPLMDNEPLSTVIEAIGIQTIAEYKNLSNSKMIGFLIRDLKQPNKLRFYNIAQTYKTVVDEAVQAVQSGVIDYNTAMRRTLKQLNNSGLKRMYWDSGYSQRLDTAVKRNILDGVREINQEVHKITGEQFGADGYEITAHEVPAPDHAPFQGHMLAKAQYERLQSNEDFKDIQGHHFAGVKRVLCQWNCKHFAYPIIIGVSKPKYSDEHLKDILDRNEKGVTLPNGTHVTGYEATQYQNKLALKVRQAKDGQIMALNAGDEDLAKEYQADVTKYTKEYNAFNAHIKAQMNTWADRKDKLTVSGYQRISVK